MLKHGKRLTLPPKRARRPDWARLWALLSLALVAGVAWWGIDGIEQQTKIDIRDELWSVLRTTQRALHIWHEETTDDVIFWANFPETREFIQSHKSDSIDSLLSSVAKQYHYLGYFILNPDGKLIAGLPREELGTEDLNLIDAFFPDFERAKQIPLISLPFSRPGSSRILMVASAPVKDTHGKVIGVLGFYLDPLRDFTQVTQLGRIGKTGETYAFDSRGGLITESRFDEGLLQAGLIQEEQRGILNIDIRDPGGNLLQGFKPALARKDQPLTRMAQSAIRGENGEDLTGYRDYRGVKVVGAWLWDPLLGIGIAAEEDFNEAFASFLVTRNLVIFMLISTLFIAALFSGYLWLQSKKLAEAVHSLEETRTNLQETVHSRNEFLSIASHELRTPMTSLRMQLDLINRLVRQGNIGSSQKEQVERMSEISSNEIGRLSRLVQNLLDVSRIVTGHLTMERECFDLVERVRKVIDRMSEQLSHAECPVSMEASGRILVNWDRHGIEQVVINLLSNAIKYAPGRPIEVDVGLKDGSAFISVRDHGPGIRKEDQARIFDRFERADSERKDSGLGLGLFIVRKMVSEHSGKIDVQSVYGEGATFTVVMPTAMDGGCLRQGAA